MARDSFVFELQLAWGSVKDVMSLHEIESLKFAYNSLWQPRHQFWLGKWRSPHNLWEFSSWTLWVTMTTTVTWRSWMARIVLPQGYLFMEELNPIGHKSQWHFLIFLYSIIEAMWTDQVLDYIHKYAVIFINMPFRTFWWWIFLTLQ